MIIIYKELIKKYIKRLSPEDIINYANSISFPISNQEAKVLYQFIQEHYLELLESDDSLKLLQPLIRKDLYQKIVSLYQENKTKYL